MGRLEYVWWLCFLLLRLDILPANAKDAPEIQPMSFPNNLKKGARFRATCSVIAGSPPFSFKWLKDRQDLRQNELVSQENFKDYSSLLIKNLTRSHAGNYTCVVRNAAGSDQYTTGLVVNAPPHWTVEPNNAVVIIGDQLKIQCEAAGFPKPIMVWTKYILSREVSVAGASNGTLEIRNASKKDDGTYGCKASNGLGEQIEKQVTVKVIVPAKFEEKFKIQTVRRGEGVTLQCQAMGDTPLEITWSQDKKPLAFAPVTGYEKFESNTENGVSSELVIPTTDRSDAALYTCVAKNEYGSDERNIKLLVVEVPAQPLDLRILEVWSRKVSVIWAEPYSGNSPVTNYVIHYWRDKEGPHRLLEQPVGSTQTSAVIEELHPGTSYSMTITAENEVGPGAPSDAARFQTAEEEPGGPPTDVWAAAKGPTSVAVSWKPPPRELWYGELKGYYVGYRSAESSQPYSFKTVETVTNDTQEVTLVGLAKSSRYSVIVKAYNGIGSGPPSEALTVRTLDGDVPLPPALSLIPSKDSAYRLKWSHAKATNAPVTGYTLHYKKGSGPWHHIPVIASEDTSYTLTDLDGGATYQVYLTASNQYGRGVGSEAIIINTTFDGSAWSWVFYKDPSLLVPAASFLVALIVVIVVVTVCIKKTKEHKDLEKSALEAEKRQSCMMEGDTQQRYIDVQDKRVCLDDVTMQSRRSHSGTYKLEELRREVQPRGYNTTEAKDRRRSSLRKSSASSHLYDSAA